MTPDSLILLASMDRWGVVRKSPRNDTSDCSLERLKTQTFVLTIHATQDSDAGEYYCTATPWIRSITTEDWKEEPEIISGKIFLNVKFACEFYYPKPLCVPGVNYKLPHWYFLYTDCKFVPFHGASENMKYIFYTISDCYSYFFQCGIQWNYHCFMGYVHRSLWVWCLSFWASCVHCAASETPNTLHILGSSSSTRRMIDTHEADARMPALSMTPEITFLLQWPLFTWRRGDGTGEDTQAENTSMPLVWCWLWFSARNVYL